MSGANIRLLAFCTMEEDIQFLHLRYPISCVTPTFWRTHLSLGFNPMAEQSSSGEKRGEERREERNDSTGKGQQFLSCLPLTGLKAKKLR